ncbi:hypothetical protein LPH48_04495 [Xylella taiwanensis]|nr:hypothetical protein [Xylella taiwanensis]EWS77090.1 hypothetical protein AF72_12640 [Xylella taiwanensis]UFN06506.1 hypothetical protein LPH42_10060 [Xylella taiwanensis]UFN13381.1 hypothetical protein LPH61_10060 [Xylella taiwanensis]UFN23433.1 hypothetical protein LPH48_04495 [Xylella taiwanensis]
MVLLPTAAALYKLAVLFRVKRLLLDLADSFNGIALLMGRDHGCWCRIILASEGG